VSTYHVERADDEARDDELERIYPQRRYVTYRDPIDHAPADAVGLGSPRRADEQRDPDLRDEAA
jgi:hypothetical protein